MMWGNYGYGGGGSWIAMALMMFFGLLVLVGIVLLVVWLARSAGGGYHGGYGGHGEPPYGGRYSGSDRACDIARERYAKGEITRDEYQEICKTLGT